ncbi:glycosyltransferase family 4 protein [Aliarcobacter cryaerophilus]|uniref:glycosyltransferase family 4 protein n=1 Tax=Aliarcobacter cryaerophilus TaxID=28198 RepID=UPI0021B5225E|nr:glycosyltransferase family 4 protein [Aliarcobacter cryaerophilus]MCT7520530.1 glycosyltransferase family 4 protein [Aliarcobacter cryaerophilus]
MKILIVNTSDIDGGAARAAYRLHQSLLDNGVYSQMLVQSKTSDNYTVLGATTKIQKAIGKLRPTIDSFPVKFYKNRTKTLFSPSFLPFSNIVDRINEINPDIVHLHWISGGMIKIEEIERIKAPIIWSLHDMWAFTGGCHYDEGCRAYEKSCGNCKVLGSNKQNDLSKKIFQRKQKVFANKKDITIVGLSKWLNECSKKSSLLKYKNHINLPNPIDINIFKPFDKEKSRELWNLPKNKKLVLFGAVGATSDPRKGFNELSEALEKIQNKDIEFVVFGSSKPENSPNFGFKTHYLGCLHDDISLVTLYSSVDVMIVPSLQENLSNAIMESLSCGTPVIGFDIGGNSDMIEHKLNGYLAKPFESKDLAFGIEWVLNNENYEKFCIKAREKIVQEFNSKIVSEKYIKLYNKVLND